MPSWVGAALLVVAAYAAGAVPWGLLLGRWTKNVDLRQHGSRSTGATNALRVLGWRVSLAVFVLDFLKGFVPVTVAQAVGLDGGWVAAVGVATVAGHCWSPAIGFRGGKGMATGAGAAAAMVPAVLLILPLVVAIVAVTRYVSLASLTASVVAAGLVIAMAFSGSLPWSVALGIVAITAIIVVQHHSNIQRLLSGTERRFGEPASG